MRVGRFAGVPRKMPRLPRLSACMFMAALLCAAAWSSVGVVRADPPPLIIPAPETATPSAVSLPPSGSSGAGLNPGDLNITPDHVEIGPNGDIGYGTPDHPIEFQLYGYRIRANQVLIHPKEPNATSAKVEVTGEVELSGESNRVLMRKLTLDESAYIADQIRMGKAPAYVDGSSFTLGTKEGVLTNPTIFFGEPDPYGLNIRAKSAVVQVDSQNIVLNGATLRIGSFPIFYLPSYTQGHEDQPPMSLQAHFGYRKDLGSYTQTTSYWTKNPVFEPGMLLDLYGDRGPLAGPAMKYNYTDDPNWWQIGKLESGFISDHGDRGLDVLNNPIPENRYFMDWQHAGSLGGEVDLTSSVSWWSDSYVLRDFRQSEWNLDQLPDNFVEASHPEQNALVSAFARFRPNDFEQVQERLPETRLDYFSSPIGETGIYQEGQADYVQLTQPNFNGTPTLHSNRFDGYYGWRRPVNFSDWATITPVAGTRITQYQDTLGQQGDFTRMLGQVGFDADMRGVGRWDYQNPIWDINGLQHIVRPVLSYRYIPAAQQGQGLIPVIDDDVGSNYPPVFDLGDTRSIDALHSQNVLRYGLENLLQTRANDYGSRDLATFNVYDDIHFQRAAGQEDFSDVWTTVGLSPARWLQVDIFNRVDPSAFTEREVRTRVAVTDGDRWKASLNASVLQHLVSQYWLDAEYRVTERVRLYGRWRYDEHVGGLTEQFYGLRQRFGQAWDFEYGIAYYRGAGQQNGFGFDVKLILLAD